VDAWDKVVREQQRIVKNHGVNLSWEIIERDCQYLDAVVREALRIKPIVGGSMRGTASTIVVDGYQIPAGWSVTYDRYLTHLLDPLTNVDNSGSNMDIRRGFSPERWLNDATRPGQEFIPFGVGPRYCLGADLAMAEMKTFLAVLARQMPSFELVKPLKTETDIPWRQKAVIPTPESGVVILPTR